VAGKRIALIGTMPPYRGGIAHFLETMARGLPQRGHSILPVTFSRQYPEFLFPGKTQLETSPGPSPLPTQRWIDSIGPWSWYRTASRIGEWHAEVAIYKYWMPFFAPAFATIAGRLRRRGVRTICVVDNAIPHEHRPFDHALSRWFLRSCDQLLVMSDTVERDLRTLGVDRPVRRVEHPIYDIFGPAVPKATARATLGLAENVPLLLFFGHVRRYKGLHVLLEALPALRSQLPDAHLVVCGEFYEDERATRKRIEELAVADMVTLHAEFVPNESVGAWFCAADLIVQPYVSATQSGVAQIAYQFERPSVITDVGSLAATIPHEEAGFVVPPNDPAALAAAIARFFLEQWDERLRAGVRRRRAIYTWDRFYEVLEEAMST
jgi:glycosyltransferase involved in cell wall biosynthesis